MRNEQSSGLDKKFPIKLIKEEGDTINCVTSQACIGRKLKPLGIGKEKTYWPIMFQKEAGQM